MSYTQGSAALSPRGVQLKQEPAATTPATAPTPADAEKAKKEKERQAAAKKSYEDLLGNFLGGKLYDLIKDNLSADKILDYGKQGIDSGASAIGDLIKGAELLDDKTQDAALGKFAGALSSWAGGKAEEWLKTSDGAALRTKISQWFEGHPGVVVAAALLAAAGAVAANLDVPEIKQKFGIGDNLKVTAAIDPGKIRDLVIKGASLGLEYKKKDFAASLTYKYATGKDGKPDTHQVGAKVGTDKAFVEGTAVLGNDGSVVITGGGTVKGDKGSVSASVTSTDKGDKTDGTKAQVEAKYGDKTANISGLSSYDTATGALIISGEAFKSFGTLSITGKGAYDSKQGASGSVKTDYTPKDKDGKPLKDAFRASLELGVTQIGGDAVSLSAEASKGNYLAAGSMTYKLDDGIISAASLKLGYRDPKEFETFLFDFKRSYAGKVPEDRLNLLIETQVKSWMFRANNNTLLQDGKFGQNVTTGQVGYQLNSDIVLYGGAKYGAQGTGITGLSDMDRGLWLQAGAQVKGVPLTVSFRPDDKAVMVGIDVLGLFGRK